MALLSETRLQSNAGPTAAVRTAKSNTRTRTPGTNRAEYAVRSAGVSTGAVVVTLACFADGDPRHDASPHHRLPHLGCP
eukprot:484705-Rhodomonas_salina.1